MIQAAKQRSAAGRGPLYNELHHLEIGAYLSEAEPGSADLIVAADVFVYVKAMEEIFSRCASTLRPGGLLAFTIEKLADGALASDGRLLQESGRYAYSPALITALAGRYTYSVVHEQSADVRRDHGSAIVGVAYVLRVMN